MAIKTTIRVRIAALILTCVGVVLAVTPAQGNAQTVAYQRENPTEALSRYLRVLASSPRDFQALLGAGRAALALGDTQSAAGFFGRAEEVWPTNAMPKAGIAAALAHEGDAQGALQYFARAAQLGAAVQAFAVERGLAFDLLGRHGEAQSDYRIALQTSDADEARRRLALSLAITGDRNEAIALLGPLMARGDPAAARVRALVLALTGDPTGARAAIEAAMPGSSGRMAYFFQRLPGLSSQQKAAAVHLGVFPTGPQPSVAVAGGEQPGDRLKSIEELLAVTANPPAAAVQQTVPTAQPIPAPAAGAAQVASSASTSAATTGVSTRRFWVQLASGPNAAALPQQFDRIKRRYPELLEDLSPYVADDAGRSRLLIGPFKDRTAASEFAEGLESSGVNAFSWTAPQGQLVRKLPSE